VTGAREAEAADLIARGLHADAENCGCVRAWPPGRNDRAVTITAGHGRNGEPVWTWQHGQATGSHPRSNVRAIADGVARIMRGGRGRG
jgi:hypothetical protein